MNTQTETTTLAGSLPALTELFRLAALYVSDDPNRKQILGHVKLAGTVEQITAQATDAFAAITYTTDQVSMNGPTIYLPADEIAAALTAATRTIGKRAARNEDAKIEATGDTWALTAGPVEIHGHHTPPANWPNIDQLYTPAEPNHQPYTMSAEQLVRLAKTGEHITHTHTNPTKPNHYTTRTNHGQGYTRATMVGTEGCQAARWS